MQLLKIALVQGHWAGDQEKTKALYQALTTQAAGEGATLIGLPELTLLPYFPVTVDKANFAWAEPLHDGPSAQFFAQIAQRHNVTLIGSLFERDPQGTYWNTATVHTPDGRLAHYTRKLHIPEGEGYHEDHYFTGADSFPVHALPAMKLATPTCYDQWFPELARIYALNGAEMLYYPTAIGSEPTAPDFDSSAAWQTVMRGHAAANGLFIAACNRTGQENGLTFYGSSFICDPTGTVLAQAPRHADAVIHATLDPAVMEQYRTLFPLLHQRRPHHYGRLLEHYTVEAPVRWHDAPSL